MSSFDPSDLLDFLDTKKKLPGERKAVFPEGVPGLEQGVPKDLYKGSRQRATRAAERRSRGRRRCAASGGEGRREIQGQAAGRHRQPRAGPWRRA